MSLEWIRERLESFRHRDAIVEGGRTLRYGELESSVRRLRQHFALWGMKKGDVTGFTGDYSAAGVTRFLAVLLEGMTAVPIAATASSEIGRALGAVPMDWFFPSGSSLETAPEDRRQKGQRSSHPLLDDLRARGHAGVVILTSGTTGQPKVILHDATRLMQRLCQPQHSYRALVFLLPDHIGGIDTLVGMLTSGSTLVIPEARTPEAVGALVEREKVELLPVTPTFLNLVLVSGAWREHDMTSLKVVSYSTEVMPDHTLREAIRAFPRVRFKQNYGSSELGVFRTRSKSSDSAFVQLEGDGVELQVRDGRLWVRGKDTMLGYLSGESSGFDTDGWYDTGDMVVEENGYLRFLGRKAEMISVGGQKVFPAEVENALRAIEGVLECSVYGEPHALMGHVVAARVSLSTDESVLEFKKRMRIALQDRLEPFKIPVKVSLGESAISHRFKKISRRASDEDPT